MRLQDNNYCYVCGSSNPAGLSVAFTLDPRERTLAGRFVPSRIHQGYEGIVHGGIISALLDEAMVKLAYSLGLPAVSAELTVQFKKPAAPGEELIVTGRLAKEAGRLIIAEASITRGEAIIALARGKLLKVSPEHG